MASYNAQASEIGQGLALHAGITAGRLARIRAELSFANRLAAAQPEHGGWGSGFGRRGGRRGGTRKSAGIDA